MPARLFSIVVSSDSEERFVFREFSGAAPAVVSDREEVVCSEVCGAHPAAVVTSIVSKIHQHFFILFI